MDPTAHSQALAKIPLKRFGTPEEIAEAALFLVKGEYANNCVLNLDGGLSATVSIPRPWGKDKEKWERALLMKS
ncbi:hypothetical protein EJ08DRAFT_587984 [Tothia fuscella]|uniref:SDR family oxidoreductase n=1 Tax=Tothia fuscella TaxID=1048955 RepID=A0A9P4NST6_9PEZI|nr:hypothetical protein EJ08DRAFT_587984 [Tothia fuscella]